MRQDPDPENRQPDPGNRWRSTIHRWKRRGPLVPVTTAIIAICVGVYGAGHLWPAIENALIFAPWLGEEQKYRFLGSAFLHAHFWHLIFNMFALWIVGQAIEPRFGTWRYISLFALSAIGGNTAVLVLADPTGISWGTLVVGASGAVFGLFGALLLLIKALSRDTSQLVILLAINLILGFIVEGISWQSHIGGLVVGLILGLIYTRTRGLWLHVGGTVITALVLSATILLTYS